MFSGAMAPAGPFDTPYPRVVTMTIGTAFPSAMGSSNINVRAARVHPAFGIVAEPVQQIEHRIGLRTSRVIPGRGVDKELPIVVRNRRPERVPGHRAAGDTGLRQPRLRSGHDDQRLKADERGLYWRFDGSLTVVPSTTNE